jgi:hypothetical protein
MGKQGNKTDFECTSCKEYIDDNVELKLLSLINSKDNYQLLLNVMKEASRQGAMEGTKEALKPITKKLRFHDLYLIGLLITDVVLASSIIWLIVKLKHIGII